MEPKEECLMARLREDEPAEWDWWGTTKYPPGPLREFDPDDWSGLTTHEKVATVHRGA